MAIGILWISNFVLLVSGINRVSSIKSLLKKD